MAKMPKGGFDVADVTPTPKKPVKGKEFVMADGTDHAMHAAMLGDDDQFVTTLPYKAPKGRP